MKIFLAALFFVVSSNTAFAGDRQHNHIRGGDRWVAPLVASVILGSLIAKQNETVVDERSIYVVPSVPGPVIQYSYGPQYYNCLVRVYDQWSGTYRNEVMTCVR